MRRGDAAIPEPLSGHWRGRLCLGAVTFLEDRSQLLYLPYVDCLWPSMHSCADLIMSLSSSDQTN